MVKQNVIKYACLISLLAFFACNTRNERAADEQETFVMADTISEPLSENPLAENHVTQDSAIDLSTELDSTDAPLVDRYGDYIYISKPKMRLYVLNKRDSVLFSCGIACGIKRGNKQEIGDYRTPEGVFKIVGIYESTEWIHKTRDGRKVKGCYGPYYLSLLTPNFNGIGIHGTNAPRSIGKRASEGCIRVKTENIITLKEKYAYGGMMVIVSGENERLPFMNGPTNRDVLPEKRDTVQTEQADKPKAANDTLRASQTDTNDSDVQSDTALKRANVGDEHRMSQPDDSVSEAYFD